MNNVLKYLDIQADRLPEKTAFADETSAVTFKELKDASDKIGSELIRCSCEKKPVPLLLDKSVLTVQIMMGVVRSGGFYIILDPAQPIARLNSILDTLEAEVLITTKEHADYALQLSFSGKLIYADEFLDKAVDETLLSMVEKEHVDTDPLYVLFT